jgi:lactate permease
MLNGDRAEQVLSLGRSITVLFGKLQQAPAVQLGINPVLTTSGNLAGSAAGKLISPQSMAIACAATGTASGDLFRKIWKYSVILLVLVIVLIVLQAYVMPGIVPQDVSGLNP